MRKKFTVHFKTQKSEPLSTECSVFKGSDYLLVPLAGFEPAWKKIPMDFKSIVSTRFHHSGV